MLRKVSLQGVNLPTLYIAENNKDAKEAADAGIPYIKWKYGMDELLKYLLRPVVEMLLPGIDWEKVLGPKRKFKSDIVIVDGTSDGEALIRSHDDEDEETCSQSLDDINSPNECNEPDDISSSDEYNESVDIAKEERLFSGTGSSSTTKLSIFDYMGDAASNVNIETLQNLNMLPKFVGDIADCIRSNISMRTRWTEGYNKKLGHAIGTFSSPPILKNLIILDISGSIPRGISSTMIGLIDTMRENVKADLIITASRSKYYPYGEDLPSPQWIRNYFDYNNESTEFKSILINNINGHEWGNVISFGDNDTPRINWDEIGLNECKVHRVYHYHTGNVYSWERRRVDYYKTGYAKWCSHLMGDKPEEIYDTSWCEFMIE